MAACFVNAVIFTKVKNSKIKIPIEIKVSIVTICTSSRGSYIQK